MAKELEPQIDSIARAKEIWPEKVWGDVWRICHGTQIGNGKTPASLSLILGSCSSRQWHQER